jgi:hypothetical protein
VKQETIGNKKDFGTIGFYRDKNVSYLVFPRSLPKTDSRVVGIKYDLLEKPELERGKTVREFATKQKAKPKRAEPFEREFSVIVRRTAVWESTVRVTATNESEARKKAARAITLQKFPESEAVVHNEIREMREVK